MQEYAGQDERKDAAIAGGTQKDGATGEIEKKSADRKQSWQDMIGRSVRGGRGQPGTRWTAHAHGAYDIISICRTHLEMMLACDQLIRSISVMAGHKS